LVINNIPIYEAAAKATAYYYQLLGISINLRVASFPSCPSKGKLKEYKRPIG